MRKNRLVGVTLTAVTVAVLLSGCLGGTGGEGGAEKITLSLQSWRVEDAPMWETKIIPAYVKTHPNIEITYEPTATTEFDAAVDARVKGGTAGDLLLCRPYDVTRTNIEKGYFAQLDDLAGLSQFEPDRFDAWSIGDDHTYCMPMAAVHGVIFYNKDIFAELGLQVPTTQEEFLDVLKAVKDDGRYDPLAYGSADSWVLSGIGIDTFGPNYWKGEEGRQGLLDGTKKLTDPDFTAAFDAFGDLRPYMPEGQASLTYPDAGQLFALGKAAVWPTGSWDISAATANGINVGAIAPPLPEAGDDLYVQVHPDMAMGVNAASKHPKEAKEFVDWLASDEFIDIFTNSLPGFFSLRNDAPPFTNPLAQELMDIAESAKGWTPRLSIDRLSSGNPSLENEKQATLQKFMTTPGMTGEEVADTLQKVLELSYTPPSN